MELKEIQKLAKLIFEYDDCPELLGNGILSNFPKVAAIYKKISKKEEDKTEIVRADYLIIGEKHGGGYLLG